MKEKPGISASPSLPFPVLGESQRYDSDPETSSKRHRNGTPEHNTAGSFWVESLLPSGLEPGHLTNA